MARLRFEVLWARALKSMSYEQLASRGFEPLNLRSCLPPCDLNWTKFTADSMVFRAVLPTRSATHVRGRSAPVRPTKKSITLRSVLLISISRAFVSRPSLVDSLPESSIRITCSLQSSKGSRWAAKSTGIGVSREPEQYLLKVG